MSGFSTCRAVEQCASPQAYTTALSGTRAEAVVVVRGFHGGYDVQQGQRTTEVCASSAERGLFTGIWAE